GPGRRGGGPPAGMVGLVVPDELAGHGWDVARATGQPYACEPDLLDAARSFLVQFASPDAPAGPDVAFGPSRPQPGDAPPLDQVVALAGRDPGWRPSCPRRIAGIGTSRQPGPPAPAPPMTTGRS